MTLTDFEPGVIVTYTGRAVKPLEITLEDISIIDIAHALSNLCRFTGHTKFFYSVAEHSVRCYDAAQENKLWALLHDASEAYINDIARPLKHSDAYSAYRVAEERLMEKIAEKYSLSWPEPESVYFVDNTLLITEIRDLMWGDDEWVDERIKPLPEKLETMTPQEAEDAFLERAIKEGLDLEENIEEYMSFLEARFSEHFVDPNEEDDGAGGALIRRNPLKPRPSFGAAIKEPNEKENDLNESFFEMPVVV